MRRVLVTGSDGQLGKSIQKIAANYPELHIDFKTSKEMDITNAHQIAEIFEAAAYGHCINCAAYTNVEMAENHPEKAFSVNAEGVRYLAESCSKNTVVLIHISTDYVFDGKKTEPYTVDDEPNPINVYGASKLKGEKHIQKILGRYFIVRTSWLYSEYGKNFYRTILEKAKREKTLFVTDSEKGCPTHAVHLAGYILDLIHLGNMNFGIHHFTDGTPMTWYDFAKRILSENKLSEIVRLEKAKNYRTFATRPANSVLK